MGMSSMFPILLLLLFTYELRMVPSASAIAVNKNPDEGILLEIKASLNQQHGVLAAWNTTTKFCHWPGVSCSLKHKDRVTVLNLTSQGFSGTITSSIGNLTFLRILDLSSNKLQGEIPVSVGQLPRLQHFNLSNNMLHGEITTQLKNCTSLERIELDSNFFTGEIPAWLGGLPLKTWEFTGSVPPEIGKLCPDYISFDTNQLTATSAQDWKFVTFLTNCTRLRIFDVQDNMLGAMLPSSASNLSAQLQVLFVGYNEISGKIPFGIRNLVGLTQLELSNNRFTGVLPESIGMLNSLSNSARIVSHGWLKGLYLSRNNLSGSIPETFENMTSLDKLDLSFNHLDGKVPLHGVFSNVTGFLFDGNLGLCGGIPELHLPPCLQNSMDDRKRKVAPIFKVILPIAGILFCFGLLLISISLKKKQKTRSTSLTELHLMDDKYPRVSYAELLQGTNGFDTNNLIGKGRYGSVYKCSLLLKNMMTTVAVKVFDLQQPGSSKSFISECEALTKIRHRNLIGVITCCSSSDSTQNDFKALVFEFMPNGSLHRWLHLDEHTSQQWHGLTLTQRLNIAVDVADALEYLHNSCEPPIVHCDLKPSNILLDQELVAHVGDFSLAKVLPNPAREYGEGGQVSPCGDVYSFGIVILELFTGLTPTEDMFKDGLTLQKHAENAFPGMLMNIVDPILVSDEEAHASTSQGARNAMEDINKVMLSITKLALSCSKHAPTERISMRDAAAEMPRIRDTIL
ncbi:unnamed protein product [Miscanthus lutarioriparius]|uniref:Receptor kinase-like protein Xa21 n=1 Tax=Miscanthus lutarioriparius TaxID=422564 RepID=A0A811QD82_9POAL|nr:unnamed protein product [Miscanthus lutarioriparius]